MTGVTTARFLVTGRVQGVFFREHTRRRAVKLSLAGHAINLSDGRVEVLVQGDGQAIDAMQDWLWQGSPLSRVTDVSIESVDSGNEISGFRTG